MPIRVYYGSRGGDNSHPYENKGHFGEGPNVHYPSSIVIDTTTKKEVCKSISLRSEV